MKDPQRIFDNLFAFPPNRETLGGTAYFLKSKSGNILIDSPAWIPENQQFLNERGGIQYLFLTHRTGKGSVKTIQQTFNCSIVVQEQEAYLLPGLPLTPFQHDYSLGDDVRIFWTPGHSPGSACLYYSGWGGVLFTGRHLLPDTQGIPKPLKVAKTFHWPRQLRHTQRILENFTPETLHYLCPGANTGFLRGKKVIEDAYAKLSQLDLSNL